MDLRTGIPRIDELDQLKLTPLYREPSEFNSAFLQRHHDALKGYGAHWGKDPFRLWSRRWEYPFAAERLLRFLRSEPGAPQLKILDAGSGVTFFPYYIRSKEDRARFVCVDYDPTYAPMFDAINRNEPECTVRFVQAPLQKLPLDDGELDAICCISVLEHTDNYPQIVDELIRVLRPGGLFVLTFDLSLDDKFTLPKAQAEQLLRLLREKFIVDGNVDLVGELNHLHDPGKLTSDRVRRTEPELLPWTFPVRVYKAMHDLVHGKGWTAGFRSRTIFCCDVRKPA